MTAEDTEARREITSKASFIDDLGADSHALVELRLVFEETFDIEIPEDEAEKIRTVRDAIEAVTAVAVGAGCKACDHASDTPADGGARRSSSAQRPACAPGEVGTPEPAAELPPMAMQSGACTHAALAALFDACFLPGGGCAAWEAVNSECNGAPANR